MRENDIVSKSQPFSTMKIIQKENEYKIENLGFQ